MKKNLFIIIASVGMFACSCSSDAASDAVDKGTEAAGGANDKVAELERLMNERDAFYDKKIEALQSGDVDASKMYEAQMDSVDAIYQDALRN